MLLLRFIPHIQRSMYIVQCLCSW